jgi:ATP-binding cassette subfamily B (MDR/TAP) protein 1
MVGRTTVVVAHRLSTVRDADAIAVVKQGSVIELGTHSELLAKGGAYATLVQMQGAQEEDEDRNRKKVIEMDKARGGQSLLQQVFKNPNWAVPGKMGGEGVVELAEEVVEVADEVADVVARTASNVVHAVETGQFTNDTSKTSTVRRRKRKWSLKKADESEEDGAEVEKGRIAALNRPEMPAAICGILGSIGMGMLTPSFSIIFSSMVGVFYVYYDDASKIKSEAQKWSLVFMGIGFGAFFSAILQSYSFNYMGQKLGRRIRIMMMGALMRQEIGWYDEEKNSSGVLATKLSSDSLAVKGQFGDTMGLLTQNIVTLVAGLIIAGVYDWRMMLVVVATLPLLAIVVIVQTRLILNYVNEESENFANANRAASEAFTAIKTVAAFGMEEQLAGMYRRLLAAPTAKAKKRIISSAVGFGCNQVIIFGIFSLSFWFAGEEVSSERADFVDVLKVSWHCFRVALSLN